jgi:hypothetical protein
MINPRKIGSLSFFFSLVTLLSYFMVGTGQTITSADPIWSACPLIKAATIAVKMTTTGLLNAHTINTTAVTYATAFSWAPTLTFAIKNIRVKHR